MITRATLSTEFFDVTSAKMLIQPQPQYLHAQLWKQAVNASLGTPDDLAMMMERMPNGAEGAAVPTLDQLQLLLDDPIYSEAFVNVTELGKTPGHTVRLNRPAFAATTYTEAAREIVGGTSISTVPVDIVNEQVSVTLKRYAGPYDQTNSRVAPFAADRFDANLSLHSIAKLLGLQLVQDWNKTIDTIVVSLMDLASTTLYPLGFSADNDATAVDAMPLDMDTILRAQEVMDAASIPRFGNGQRALAIDPRGCRQLANDPQFAAEAVYAPPLNTVLKKSYYKTVGGFDLFKTATLNAPANASSVPVFRCQAFGPGVIGSGLGEMPRVTFSTDDNYGEQAKVIWLTYAAFRLLDNRFCVSVRHS